MSRTPEERLAVVETHSEIMREDIADIKADLATIKEAVTSVKGGWKVIAAISGLAATVGAALATWIGFFRS